MKMMDKIKMAMVALVMVVMGGIMVAPAVLAEGSTLENINKFNPNKEGSELDLTSTGKKIIEIFLGIIGFLSVIMIIYGGFLYTTSAGDSSKVTKAKNTIMYGIIGLIIALLAFAIVNFVLNGLFKK